MTPRIAIDARKLRDFGIGTYIRNILIELSRLDRATEYVVLCRPDDVESGDVLGPNFRMVPETAGVGQRPSCQTSRPAAARPCHAQPPCTAAGCPLRFAARTATLQETLPMTVQRTTVQRTPMRPARSRCAG